MSPYNPFPESVTFLTGGCLWPLINKIAETILSTVLLAGGIGAVILCIEFRKTKAMRQALRKAGND